MSLTLQHLLHRAREQIAARKPEAAIAYLEAALLRDPRSVLILFELGRIAITQQRPDQALHYGRRILGLSRPERPALGHLLVGNGQRARGDHTAAIRAYREALRLEPNLTEAICNLGGSLLEVSAREDAIRVLRAGLELATDDAAMQANLGLALHQSGLLSEAAEALGHAVRLQPSLGKVWLVLGSVMLDLGRVVEAQQAFQQAIAHLETPETIGVAQYNLALTFILLGRRAEALLLLAQALEKAPGLVLAEGAMLYQAQAVCHWELLEHLVPRVLHRIRTHPEMVVEPFSGLAMPQAEMSDHRLIAAAYARRNLPPADAPLVPRGHRWKDGRRRLRVGFLSGEFRNHPAGILMAGLLEAMDRSRIEMVALTYGPETTDVFRQRCLAACDSHMDLNAALAVASREGASVIASLRLDVLLDLTCYTSGTKSDMLRFRPAPVQGHYLGYCSTAGSPLYDFTLLDAVTVRPEEHAHFDESVLNFAESYYPILLPPAEFHPVTRAEAGVPAGAFVFASMNQSHKLSRPVFRDWCALLARVPHAILWLLAMPAEAEAALRQAMRAEGLDPSRLIIAPRVEPARHAARLPLVDLGLDTAPYGSHTTAMDLLCAGVPLVTCHGTTVPARVASSILMAAGLGELVLPDSQAVLDFATRFAKDEGFRSAVRGRVAEAFAPARSAMRLAAQGAELSRLLLDAHEAVPASN